MVARTKIYFLIVFFCIICISTLAFASQDVAEQMLGFSLSNFNEENEKVWDLKGDTLEMYGDLIQLTVVKARVYGDDDNFLLVADKGTFDRTDGKVHLEDNVIITSDSGAKVMTETLDWLQKTQTVSTKDKVTISKDSMEAVGVGAVGKSNLKQLRLEKEVQVDIEGKASEAPRNTTITCDGPLDIDYEKQIAIFNVNVKADDGESQLFADKMTAYFDKKVKSITKILAEGSVKIVRGDDIAYCEQALYDVNSKKISLEGRPKLVIYSDEGLGAAGF